MSKKPRPRVMTSSIRIPIDPPLKKALEDWAKAEGISRLSDAARRMIRNGLARDVTLAENINRQAGKALTDFDVNHRKHLSFPDPSAEGITWSDLVDAIEACSRLGLTDVASVLRQGDFWQKEELEEDQDYELLARVMDDEYWRDDFDLELRIEICLLAQVVLRAVRAPAQEAKDRLKANFRESVQTDGGMT